MPSLLLPAQLVILAFAADYGASFDYEKTLPAIALKESSAVQDTCNVDEDSCGPFGNRVSVVARRSGLSQDVVRSRLRTDLRFAAHYAVAELDWWRSHCKTWEKAPGTYFAWIHIWGHYNGGDKPNLDYGREIMAIIRKVKE